MLEICFFVEDMTSLRYAIPFIKKTKELFGINVPLVYDGGKNTGKYNSILLHSEKFKSIVEKNGLESIDSSIHRIESEKVACVENVNSVACKQTFSFQHSFDYRNLAEKNKKSTYLAIDNSYAKEIEIIGNKVMVQPSPVVFWDGEENCLSVVRNGLQKVDDKNHTKKHVTIFYPEYGGQLLVSEIAKDLHEKGYQIHIKQRKKHQAVPENFNDIAKIYYDEEWYPSESCCLPSISEFCVGFGTSAYCDLVKVGINFLDANLTQDSKTFIKPNELHVFRSNNNFRHSLEDLNSIKNWVSDKASSFVYRKPQVNFEKIKLFLDRILAS